MSISAKFCHPEREGDTCACWESGKILEKYNNIAENSDGTYSNIKFLFLCQNTRRWGYITA